MNLPPLNPLPKTTKKKERIVSNDSYKKIKVFNNDAKSLRKKKPTKKRKFKKKLPKVESNEKKRQSDLIIVAMAGPVTLNIDY